MQHIISCNYTHIYIYIFLYFCRESTKANDLSEAQLDVCHYHLKTHVTDSVANCSFTATWVFAVTYERMSIYQLEYLGVSSGRLYKTCYTIRKSHIPQCSTVKPVYNDHPMGYFSAFWSSSRWPRATLVSSRSQKLLARVNWYLRSSLKHIIEQITGNKFYYRGGRYRQVSLYFVIGMRTHEHISVTKWCIAGYLSDALCDFL